MGLSDLRSLAALESVELDAFSGAAIAVDAHNWLYRYLNITVRYMDEETYTAPDGTEVAHLIGAFRGLPLFFEHGLLPVFVFDGAVLGLKEAEMADRKAKTEAALENAREAAARGDSDEAARYRAHGQWLDETILETTKQLFAELSIPTIEAPGEGEAQAAAMARNGDVDLVGTEDYDALLFGAPSTLRSYTGSGDAELMDFAKTLADLGVTHEQLVDIAILCGTDFNDGIHGIGPKTALSGIKEYGRIESFLASRGKDESIPRLSEIRSLYLEPAVADTYTVPTHVDIDASAGREYLVSEWGVPEDVIDTAFQKVTTNGSVTRIIS